MKKLLILAILLFTSSAWAVVAMVGTPTTGASVAGCHSLVGATVYTCTRPTSTVGNWLLITVKYGHSPTGTTIYPIVPIVYPAGISLSTGDYPIPLFVNPVAPAFINAGNQSTTANAMVMQAWAARVFTGGSVTATVTLTGIPSLTSTRGVDISISEISGADPDILPTVYAYAGATSAVTTVPQSVSGIASGDLVVSYIGASASVSWTCTASWTCTNGTARFDFISWITASSTSQSNSTVVGLSQNANIIVDFAQPNASIARYTSAASGDWNTNANWTCSATGPCTNLHPTTTTDVVNITAGKAMLCTVSTTCNFGQLYQYGGSLENAGTLVGNSSATAGQLLWALRSSGTSNTATFTNDPGATMSTIGNAGVDNAAAGTGGVLISIDADPGPSAASSNFIFSGTFTQNGVVATANHSHYVPQAGSVLNIGTTTTTTTGYRISTSGDNGLETGEADGVNSCLGAHPPSAWTAGNFATIQTLAGSNQQAYIEETSYGSLFKSCYIKLLGLGDNTHASVTAGGWDTDPADGIAGHLLSSNSTQIKYWRAPIVNGTGVFHLADFDLRPIKLGNVNSLVGGQQAGLVLSPGYYDPTISRYVRHSTFVPATGSGVTTAHGGISCDTNATNNNRCNGIEFSDNVMMTIIDASQWHGADDGTPAKFLGSLWMRYDDLNAAAYQIPLIYTSYLCNQMFDGNIQINMPATPTLSHWLLDRNSTYCTQVAGSSDSNRVSQFSNSVMVGFAGSQSTDGAGTYSYNVDNVSFVDANSVFFAFNVPAPVHAMVDHYSFYSNHSGAANNGLKIDELQYTGLANTNALVAWFRNGVTDFRYGGTNQGAGGTDQFPLQDGWVQCDVISPASITGTTATITTQNCKDGTGGAATLATNQFATLENLSDPNCAFLNHWSATITVTGSTVTFTAGNHASPVVPTNPTCNEANGRGKIMVGFYYDKNNFTNWLTAGSATQIYNRAFNTSTNTPGSLTMSPLQTNGDYKRISAAQTVTIFTDSAHFGTGAGHCTGVVPGDYVVRAIDSTPTPNFDSPQAMITAVDGSCNLTLGFSNLSTATTHYNGIDGPGGPWTITAGTTTIYFFSGLWNNGYYGDGKEGHGKYETAIDPVWANPGVTFVDWYNKVTSGSATCALGSNPAVTCTPYAGLRDNAICYNGLALDGVTTCTFNNALHWWYLDEYLLQNYRMYQGGFANSVRDSYDPTTGVVKYSDNGARTTITCLPTAPCAGKTVQLQVYPAALL